MKLRPLFSTAATTFAIALLAMAPVATAADLGSFTVGDVITMPKDCDGNGFAHVHVVNDSLVQVAFFNIDPLIDPYLHPTATYGVGAFSVTIHCDPTQDLHDPTNVTFNYTFEVAAAAATTTTSSTTTTTSTTVATTIAPPATTGTTAVANIPATGAATTTSIALIGAFAVIVGASLLLVRRRSPA